MGTALGYAVANRGGDFNDIYATLEYCWSPERAHREFATPRAVDPMAIQGKALVVKRPRLLGRIVTGMTHNLGCITPGSPTSLGA
jgi:hypothetical protein